MKQEATERVLVAIRRILDGKSTSKRADGDKMLHRFVGDAPPREQSPIADLTDRELEVFRLIGAVTARGRSPRNSTSA